MMKTNSSPEDTEVTPSKKKLKQARLPFMVVSDGSPKTDVPPTRKRKLSVPEAEPVTKIGKLSEKSKDSEDLVVISDDESKVTSSSKKVDKSINPYVKLVDTARKKKLQKTKNQKKGKTKKESKSCTEKQSPQENGVNSEYDDVEMVEVDVIIHEEGESASKNNSNKVLNGEAETKSVNKQSKNNNKSPIQITSKSESESTSTDKSSMKTVESVDAKEITDKTNDKVSEVICLEDSNNSCDVQVPENTSSVSEKQEEVLKQPSTLGNAQKNSPKSKPTVNKVTPKRSSRIKTKEDSLEKSKTNPLNKDKKVATKQSHKDTVKPSTSAETKTKTEEKNSTNSANGNDSDVEMIELDSEQNKKLDQSSNKPDKNAVLEKNTSEDISEQSLDETNTTITNENSSTPTRSMRNKNKTDEANDLNESTVSSKLDESMVSNPSTPRQNKSLSEKEGDKSMNDSMKTANLTPKQLQKKLEFAKKREEREKEKQEREKKRQQEKEERAKQRQEKEDQKKREREEKEEAKRKEKEEKEEQRRKEREEKEKLKEMERKAKEMKEELKKKEKEAKEEERRKEKEARDEEKRKKQEAMELEKQEQELKKKKAAEAFVNFFVPKQKVEREPSTDPVSRSTVLSSFAIKAEMRLAPTTRTSLTDDQRENLEKNLLEQGSGDLYLKCLKNGTAKPLSSGKTWPLEDKDDDVIVVEDELPPIDGAGEVITCESAPREKLRPKLLSFHENRRPPYWGTWRKKSLFVKARRPFGQEKQLDYEVDSDDDWEDEADGESLDGSAGGSDDEAGADDYEVDNEVFVPHGYLSDEEATMDEDDRDVLSLSPDTQKARLKHLEDEFESELKKPTEKLKPRLYGILWETPEGGKPENCVDALWNYFEKFAMIMNDPTPFLQPSQETEESEKKKIKKKKVLAEVNEQSPKSEKKKKTENKESKKPKQEAKKTPNQPGINSFLKKVNST